MNPRGWENERHPVARLLLQPLRWSVAFLPFTLAYYAVVLSVLALAGLALGAAWLATVPARLRRRKGSTGHPRRHDLINIVRPRWGPGAPTEENRQMGHSTTPAYVVEVNTPGYRWEPAAWQVRARGRTPGYGQPTDAGLAEYVRRFEESTRPGGVNAHLGATRVTSAVIRRNEPGSGPVATYEAPPQPLFTVVAGNL